MRASHDMNPTIPTTPVLYLSLELGQKNWKLAFTVGLGQKPRLRTIAARDTEALMAEITAAKKRFGLPENAAVASRPAGTAPGSIASSPRRRSRTWSSIPRASRSTAASGGPSPTASTR